MKQYNNTVTNNQGFSFLEVITVLGIIVFGMFGITTLVMQNIQVQSINKNNLIASQLAQEGIELVRKVRDTNWIEPGALWYEDIYDDTDADNDYAIYIKTDGVVAINNTPDSLSDPGAKIYYKDNFYGHDDSGSPTMFSRLINVSSGTKISVKSTVRWTKNGVNHDYVAETELYDWR